MIHVRLDGATELSDSPQRVLIVRLSALGDTVLTLPLAQHIRTVRPETFLGWLVGEAAAPVLAGVDAIDRIHILPRQSGPTAWRELLASLKAARYDVALDPQGITRSAIWPWLAGIPERIGFVPGPFETREMARWLLNRQLDVASHITPIWERTLALSAGLGIASAPSPVIPYRVDAVAASMMADWWRQHGLDDDVLLVGVGAGWPTKVWPLDRLAPLLEAARHSKLRPVILWGPTELNQLKDWRRILGASSILAPPTDVAGMLALIDRCRAYAGPDSAGLHMAAMLGKPTFSWFGASDPTRCAPRGVGHVHVALGPHHWRRQAWGGNPLGRLKTEDVLPIFEDWLAALPLAH